MVEKFAVYLVMVEDTSDADTDLSEEVLAMERIGGNLTWGEAEDILTSTPLVNTDVAR